LIRCRARRIASVTSVTCLALADDPLVQHVLQAQELFLLTSSSRVTGTPVHFATTSAISSD